MDGTRHLIEGKWDLIIAHPPCTDLATSGARWFPEKQKDMRQQKAVAFFMHFVLAPCERIAVENPIGIMSTCYEKPTQIVQPWWFGDPYEKSTCLWLKGLPALKPTNPVEPEPRQVLSSGRSMPAWYSKGGKERQKLRSKTFDGMAQAMGSQWG